MYMNNLCIHLATMLIECTKYASSYLCREIIFQFHSHIATMPSDAPDIIIVPR